MPAGRSTQLAWSVQDILLRVLCQPTAEASKDANYAQINRKELVFSGENGGGKDGVKNDMCLRDRPDRGAQPGLGKISGKQRCKGENRKIKCVVLHHFT